MKARASVRGLYSAAPNGYDDQYNITGSPKPN